MSFCRARPKSAEMGDSAASGRGRADVARQKVRLEAGPRRWTDHGIGKQLGSVVLSPFQQCRRATATESDPLAVR